MLVTQVEKHVRSVFAAHAGPAVDDDGDVFVHALKAGGFDGADGFDGYVDGSGDVPVSIFACGADVYKSCGVFSSSWQPPRPRKLWAYPPLRSFVMDSSLLLWF